MWVSYHGVALGMVILLASCTSTIRPESVERTVAAGDDTCGAADYAPMVGQKVTVLNDAALPEDARVLFPGASVTQDFQAGRLNITIGTDDTISRVYCG